MMMSGRHDDDAGGAYLETKLPLGEISSRKSTGPSPASAIFLSVRCRNLPPRPVFWPHLVCVGDGHMSEAHGEIIVYIAVAYEAFLTRGTSSFFENQNASRSGGG